MIHEVTKNDNCYYCTRCGKASGDGDGLVGEKCNLLKITVEQNEFSIGLIARDEDDNIVKENYVSTVGVPPEEVEAKIKELGELAKTLDPNTKIF